MSESSRDGVQSWTESMSARDRIRAVAETLREPRAVNWLSEQADAAWSTTNEELQALVEQGQLRRVETSENTRYQPDYTRLLFEEIRTLIEENTPEELRSELAAITEEIEAWQETYDVETWEELEQSLADGDLTSAELRGRRDVITRWEENLEDRRLIKHALALYSDVEAARDPASDLDLTSLQSVYDQHPDVVATELVARRPGFRRDEKVVLSVDVAHIDRVTPLARQARQLSAYPVGDLACFNVDFSREFQYCLETGADPTPASELSTLRLSVPVTETSNDVYGELAVAGDTITGPPTDLLTAVQGALDAHDPDVLVCSTSEIVPTLYEMATDAGVDDFSLSRWPGIDYQQLASRSTYSSCGQMGHSPARYNVPDRAIIDKSNTFFYGETNLDGVLDLVSRSKKPVQELAWASIGNVLTAIQICEANDRGVLVPCNSWRHEFYKSVGTLHDADRGGFIFAPEVGFHENVHELDFSSLYPNIICTRNVSPDIIRCDCHSDRDDVPGLGYSICDDRGYLFDVLQPIIDARDEIKAAIRREKDWDDPDEDRLAELEGRSGALKWILVACFGYQGFSNAKFGRIECHEAINAFAREILLTEKHRLEAGGWRVVHGIVDSIWVTPDPDIDDDREDLEGLATEITETVEIRLEHEAHYDWVAFVPQREIDAGALTKYFGKVADADEFKVRGIEARQRSAPPFIEEPHDDAPARRDPKSEEDCAIHWAIRRQKEQSRR